MLKTLKDLFDRVTEPPRTPQQAEHELQLGAAVLLVEVMRTDASFDTAERDAVIGSLREIFSLSPDESDRLFDLAHRTSQESTDFFSFTSRINEAFSVEQKVAMIESMWRVAYADGRLSAHENHVMRKIADLLYVPQGAYVHAKARARDAAAAAVANPQRPLTPPVA